MACTTAGIFIVVFNKDHMRPIYISSVCLRLVHKGIVAICNIRSLQFIFSALRLLAVERVSTCQYNRLKIPFVLFS